MNIVKFGDVVNRIDGNEDRLTTNLKYYVGGEHYKTGDLKIDDKGIIAERDLGYQFHYPFKKGDVLFMTKNPYLKKCGMVSFEGICSIASFVLRSKDDSILLQEYLPIICQTDTFWNYLEENKSGSVNYFITWKTLSSYEFELPDMSVQKKISNVIWQNYKTIESYRSLLDKTNEFVKARYIEMFGDPNNNSNYQLFEDAFTIRDDLRKPLSDSVRINMRRNARYPYYGANGQVDLINEYIADYGNAICLAEDCGAYGADEESSYIIRGKCWVNNHAHVLIPKDNCNIYYLNKYLHMLDITKRINGSTRQKLTQSAMKDLPLIIPSKEKQDEFGEFVEMIDKAKLAIQESLKSAEEMMKSLINRKFGD